MTDTAITSVWLEAPNGDRSWVHPPTPLAQQPADPIQRPKDES